MEEPTDDERDRRTLATPDQLKHASSKPYYLLVATDKRLKILCDTLVSTSHNQQARLFAALKELAKDKPCTAVALGTGFASMSAFHHLLKRTFGTSPGNFF